MGRKSPYSHEEKIKVCEDYIRGKRSLGQIANDYGLKKPSGAMKQWIEIYRKHGEVGLLPTTKNASYTKEFKTNLVKECIAGQDSVIELATKHNISPRLLYQWISLYNDHIELKDYSPNQEVYMADARRKTTFKERKEIVEYCTRHDRNYKDSAAKFNISYSQVYSWVKKYDISGDEALIDKRGHHKTDDEVDELERLRRENARLKRQLEENDMITKLLKKAKEFERM